MPGAAARTWLAEREADLLPIGYFHVVFTLPAEIGANAFHNKAILCDVNSPSYATPIGYGRTEHLHTAADPLAFAFGA